jgi:Carbonic anhydrase
MFGNQEPEYKQLLINNEEWIKEKLAKDPDYFVKHAQGQKPEFLWIGCSDSRVPPQEICKTKKE